MSSENNAWMAKLSEKVPQTTRVMQEGLPAREAEPPVEAGVPGGQ
jgi:hypothetical protein